MALHYLPPTTRPEFRVSFPRLNLNRLARHFVRFLAVAVLLTVGTDAQAQVRVLRAAPVAVAPENAWTDEQFDQWAVSFVFSSSNNGGSPRKGFDTMLALQVDEIDRVCRLTDEQKKKLRLMGWGDVKRVMDVLDKARPRFNQVNNDTQQIQEVIPILQPLQTATQGGIFRGDSLFAKSLRHTLTGEQFARYSAAEKERRAFQHRARIEYAVNTIEQQMPLRDAQRRGLIDVLTKETKPSRATGQNATYVVLGQMGQLPEQKVKPLFSDAEWKVYSRFVAQYRGFGGQVGAGADEVEGEDAPAAVPDRTEKK